MISEVPAGRVIIVGGGVGGVAAAIALRRAGIAAAIFEQATDVRQLVVGGGFHMWTNAMRALKDLGVDEAIIDRGAPIERSEFRNPKGKLLGSWPVGDLGRSLRGPDTAISRKDLQTVLLEALQDGELTLAARLESFRQEADGVTAVFADGREERGALLIGADGLHSVVRTQLLGAAEPRFAGYTQWQTTTKSAAHLVEDEVDLVVFGPGIRAVMHHVGGGRLFWAGVVYGPEGSCNATDAPKQMLLDRFEGWEPPIHAAIEATPDADIRGLDIYDRDPVKRWGEGRVTLLGDAAHPLTTNLGQGANLALEDAVTLARCLRGGSEEVAALRTYESLRIKRTSPIVVSSRRIAASGKLKAPLACALRDRMFGFALDRFAMRDHRRFVTEFADFLDADGADSVASSG